MKKILAIEIPVEFTFSAELEEVPKLTGLQTEIIITNLNWSDTQMTYAATNSVLSSLDEIKLELLSYIKKLKNIDLENQAEIKYQFDLFKDF